MGRAGPGAFIHRRLSAVQHAMTRTCCLAVCAALVAGCSAPLTQPPDEPSDIHVDFACDNGERLALRFVPGVAWLMRGGSTVELRQERMGSGFRYSRGALAVQGKGDDITIEAPPAPPL